MILVSRVVHVKERQEQQIVNCNGSISMVPLTHYCPQIIRVFTPDLRERCGEGIPTILHGSTCRENDILDQGLYPKIHRDDYLIHFAVGAYNSNLSPSFIFESPDTQLF